MDAESSPNTSRSTHSKSALYQAAQAAVADQRTKAAEHASGRVRRNRTALRALLGLLMVAGAILLIWQPAWLVGPSLPAEPLPIRIASAELTLVDAVGRVQTYAARTGRLPTTLDEAGVTNRAIAFRRLGAQDFEVSLSSGDSLIRLRPSSPIESIAAGAIRVLQGRR